MCGPPHVQGRINEGWQQSPFPEGADRNLITNMNKTKTKNITKDAYARKNCSKKKPCSEFFKDWEPKVSQRERTGTVNNSKWNQNKTSTTQMEPKENQKGANHRKLGFKIMPWSFRSFSFLLH